MSKSGSHETYKQIGFGFLWKVHRGIPTMITIAIVKKLYQN